MKTERNNLTSNPFLIPAIIFFTVGCLLLGYHFASSPLNTDPSVKTASPPEAISKKPDNTADMVFNKPAAVKENKLFSTDLKSGGSAATPTVSGITALPLLKAGPLSPPIADEASHKTLIEKENKTVSVELKSGIAPMESLPSTTNAAAQKETIAVAPKETIVVAPTAIKPPVKRRPAQAPLSPKLHHTVQISSHQEKQPADEMVNKLKRYGFPAFVVASKLPGTGTRYRVRIGSFTDKAAAERKRSEISKKTGMPSIIVAE